MTVAAVVTMAVSLTALGGVLIMRQAINKATVQWQGGVQLAIFMKAGASRPGDHRLSATELDGHGPPGGQELQMGRQSRGLQRVQRDVPGEPTLVKVMSRSQMPPSFRVVPAKAQSVTQLANDFDSQPGVYNVDYPGQAIQEMLAHFSTLRDVALVVAGGVMLGAIALVVNTIQLAIFARRREVAVMKLVGATNWFIRVPFMLEGLVDGLVGACVAFTLTYFARDAIASFMGSDPLDLRDNPST